MSGPRAVTVFTHQYPQETRPAVERLLEAAAAAGVEVLLPREEVEKHGLEGRGSSLPARATDPESAGGPEGDAGPSGDVAVVFGGDGTILKALRIFVGRSVPVFAFNYGAIGFLSTVDHGALEDGIERVLSGDFETLSMPALAVRANGETRWAVNEVSVHRRPDGRVAELAYLVADEQLGRVRCDGLVAATPVGSTGYNLANGGPVLAWGVQGFVVSFIAPHTLTARALVVAPDGVLKVLNVSEREGVDITTDGRTIGSLASGGEIEVGFERDRVLLAQVPGWSSYRRLREKFGRLAY